MLPRSRSTYDSDFFQIGIDNHTSRTITNQADNFIPDITPTKNMYRRGVGGNLKVHREGTLIWKINDDRGRTHELTIKNALYVPNLPNTCGCFIHPPLSRDIVTIKQVIVKDNRFYISYLHALIEIDMIMELSQ